MNRNTPMVEAEYKVHTTRADGESRLPEETQNMLLTGADGRAFIDVLLSPPEPAHKLIAALRRHKTVTG